MQNSTPTVGTTRSHVSEASAIDPNSDVSAQQGNQRGRSISYTSSSRSSPALKALPLATVDERGKSPRRILHLGNSPTSSPGRLASRNEGVVPPPGSAANSTNSSPRRLVIDGRTQEMGARFVEGIQRSRSTPTSLISRESDTELKKDEKTPRSKVERILREITSTEETQNQALAVLAAVHCTLKQKEDFFTFLKKKHLACERKNIDEIKIQGQQVLTSLLEEAQRIKAFSDGILRVLSTAWENPTPLLTIATTFAGMSSCCAPYHKAGRVYNDYLEFQKLLTAKGKEKCIVALNGLLPVECKESRLKFEDYASFLIQRMPRYNLFFEQLLFETSSDDPVFPLLEKALKNFKEGTRTMTNATNTPATASCDRSSSEASDDSQSSVNLNKKAVENKRE